MTKKTLDNLALAVKKIIWELFLLSLPMLFFYVMSFIYANIPGSPNCFSINAYSPANARETYFVDSSKLSNIVMNASSGEWINSGVYLSSSQGLKIDVSGSVSLTSSNQTICASNVPPSNISLDNTTPNPLNITLSPSYNIPGAGYFITVNLLDDSTSCNTGAGLPSVYGKVTWEAGANKWMTQCNNPTGTISPSGTIWSSSSGGGTCFGSKGMGLGFVVGGTEINNIDYDFAHQPVIANTNVSFFSNAAPVINPENFSGYGFSIDNTGANVIQGPITFNLYNDRTIEYGCKCEHLCRDGLTRGCDRHSTSIYPGCKNPVDGSDDKQGDCINGYNFGADPSKDKIKLDFSTNDGGYAFKINYQGCFANNGLVVDNSGSCGPLANAGAGALQYCITSYNPNNDPADENSNPSACSSPRNFSGTLSSGKYYSQFIANDQLANPEEGYIWYRVYDTTISSNGNLLDDAYNDNNGQYYVSTSAYNKQLQFGQSNPNAASGNPVASGLASFLTYAIIPLKENLSTARAVIFSNFTSTATFSSIIYSSLTLYICLYGMFYLMGMVKLNQKDFVTRIFKIGVVLALLSPGSWNFFNNYLFSLFEGGGLYLAELAVGVQNFSYTDNSAAFEAVAFSFVDNLMALILSPNTWFMIASILSMANYILALILVYSLYTIFKVAISVVINYMVSLIAISLLICVAPLFIICILFEKTKGYFEKWYQQLFSYSIQPFILFTLTIYLIQLSEIFFISIFDSGVCKKLVEFPVRIPGFPSLFNISFYIYFPVVRSFNSYVLSSISLLIITRLLYKSGQLAATLSEFLTNTVGTGTAISGKGSMGDNTLKSISSRGAKLAGMHKDSKAKRINAAAKNRLKEKG